jgi:hypothetical protein
MSQYQTSLIPVDSELSHLETALNSEKMKAVFQHQLCADESEQIIACEIERIKYKPHKNCHISYRLRIKNDRLKNNVERLVGSRFYEPGGAVSRFLKETDNRADQDLLLHIPELDCVTWVFPYDRKLTHLKQLADSDSVYQMVAPILMCNYVAPNWSVQNFEAEVIRYVPEHTCSVRTKIDVVCNYSNEHDEIIAYGKTYYDHTGQQAYRIMLQLWESEACREERLNIPEPVVYQSQYRMLWQLGVPGIMLSELRDKETLFLNSVANAARQVATLHQIPLHDCPITDQEYLYQQLNKVEKLIDKFNIPCPEKIRGLISTLIPSQPSVSLDQLATLHGDLHLKNILVDDNRVFLIDLDDICVGDPLQDIGSFTAAIINQGFIGALSRQLVEQTIFIFLQTYFKSVPWIFEEKNIRWHIATALVTERIFRSFTRLKAGRMEIVGDLVEQAEILLDESFTPYWLRMKN